MWTAAGRDCVKIDEANGVVTMQVYTPAIDHSGEDGSISYANLSGRRRYSRVPRLRLGCICECHMSRMPMPEGKAYKAWVPSQR